MTPQDYFNICDIAHKSGFITKEQQQEILQVVQKFLQEKKQVPIVAILKKYGLHDDQFRAIQQQKERLFRQTVANQQIEQQRQQEKELELSFSQTISVGASKKIGKYDIVKLLGSGAMGSVYLAKDPNGKKFALKTMLPAVAESKVGLKRFQQEVNAMKMLRHPNIIKIFEIGQQDDTHYFTMEYIEGKPLSEYVQDKMSAKKIAYVMEKVARALDYAHSKDIIHRDIKPANIMISKDGEPVIMDFGLARQSQSDNRLTKTGAMLGTLAYMPPEQVQGNKREIDHQTDIYALGASMYELMTRQLPFSGQHLVVLRKIVQDDPTPPRELNNLIPEALERICLKAMAKKKEFRFSSAMEMAEDLQRFQGGETIEARLDRASISKKGKVQILRIAVAVACIGVIILLGSLLTSTMRDDTALKTVSDQLATAKQNLEDQKKYYSDLLDKKNNQIEELTLQNKNYMSTIVNKLTVVLETHMKNDNAGKTLSLLKTLLLYKEHWKPQHIGRISLALDYVRRNSYEEQELYLKVDMVKTAWRISGEAIAYADKDQKMYFMECFLEICCNYVPLSKANFSTEVFKKYDALARRSKLYNFKNIGVPKNASKDTLEKLPEISHKYYLLSDYYDEKERTTEDRKMSLQYLEKALQLNSNQPAYIQEMSKFYKKLYKQSVFTNKEYEKKSDQLRREAIRICKVYVKLLPIFQKTLDRLQKR
ncbi:serine/threonine protein kinase [Candidatus Uabimicrobium amorphum]|uniref:non-specific serine/threonine protein kinase n=1 Tax=Uabimicrobium amorphum TaxID=2596890 RepID=A0A5S9IUD1_UABAM|nr:serine/threonine-protein kinase [Candidatus Uabimicrobium amorphum]BBM86785.1 protein kinase [Candidatus Uabimicrobium amorphum]